LEEGDLVMDDKVNAILEKYELDGGFLVSILQDIQKEYNYLPRETLLQVSQGLKIPLSRIHHVATFFKAFSLTPRGRHTVCVCMGTACHVRGAQKVMDNVTQRLGINPDETTDDLKFTVERVNCVGTCAQGPMVLVDGDYFGTMSSDKVEPMLKKYN
jgi:NADH-quinone oxidoreductase subunit E